MAQYNIDVFVDYKEIVEELHRYILAEMEYPAYVVNNGSSEISYHRELNQQTEYFVKLCPKNKVLILCFCPVNDEWRSVLYQLLCDRKFNIQNDYAEAYFEAQKGETYIFLEAIQNKYNNETLGYVKHWIRKAYHLKYNVPMTQGI